MAVLYPARERESAAGIREDDGAKAAATTTTTVKCSRCSCEHDAMRARPSASVCPSERASERASEGDGDDSTTI